MHWFVFFGFTEYWIIFNNYSSLIIIIIMFDSFEIHYFEIFGIHYSLIIRQKVDQNNKISGDECDPSHK